MSVPAVAVCGALLHLLLFTKLMSPRPAPRCRYVQISVQIFRYLDIQARSRFWSHGGYLRGLRRCQNIVVDSWCVVPHIARQIHIYAVSMTEQITGRRYIDCKIPRNPLSVKHKWSPPLATMTGHFGSQPVFLLGTDTQTLPLRSQSLALIDTDKS